MKMITILFLVLLRKKPRVNEVFLNETKDEKNQNQRCEYFHDLFQRPKKKESDNRVFLYNVS